MPGHRQAARDRQRSNQPAKPDVTGGRRGRREHFAYSVPLSWISFASIRADSLANPPLPLFVSFVCFVCFVVNNAPSVLIREIRGFRFLKFVCDGATRSRCFVVQQYSFSSPESTSLIYPGFVSSSGFGRPDCLLLRGNQPTSATFRSIAQRQPAQAGVSPPSAQRDPVGRRSTGRLRGKILAPGFPTATLAALRSDRS